MRTTLIKRSGLGHDIDATCRYIGDYSSKAHDLSTLRTRYQNNPRKLAFVNKHCTKRNLALRGIGVPINGWRHTAATFKRLAKLKPKNSVKTINLVISPSKGSVDPYNIDQVNKFADFCEAFTKRWYPRHLAYLAVQCDNRNKITHCHIIVSALSTLPPHNEMRSSDYEDHHLQRAFNQSAKNFNQKQNVIKLGLAITGQSGKLKPFITDKYLIKHAKDPLNNLIAGKDRNKTALKNDFKLYGIRLKLRTHRHRKHDSNGHAIYRKYKSGQKAGQYIYRKNRHGNSVKVPEYRYVEGVSLSPIHKIENNKRHSWVHGSRLAELTGNKEFNGRFMMSVLYKIRKGNYKTPTKSSAAIPKSTNASVTAKSKASQVSSASTASQLASNRNSIMNSAWRDSLVSKASQLSSQRSNHSLAVQKQLRTINKNYNSMRSNIVNSYATNQSLAIQNQDPVDTVTNQQIKLGNIQGYEVTEIKRVMNTLPKISNKDAQLYAAWLYKFAVPSKAVAYKGLIPKVNLRNKDKKLAKKLINPIAREFRLAKIKARIMWHAGLGAIRTFLHHIGSLSGIMKRINIFNPFRLHQARRFHKIWKHIRYTFNYKFTNVAKRYLRAIKNREKRAQNEYASSYISQVSQAANTSSTKSLALSSLNSSYSSASNDISDSNSQWLQSFNDESNSSLNTNLRNYEAKMQSNIQTFSDSDNENRPGKLPKAPDNGFNGPEL